MKKVTAAVLIFMLALLTCTAATKAQAPYEGYNYDYWKNVIPTPAAYAPVDSISGSDVGSQRFVNPADMFITDDGVIYLLDSGNNRIVIFDDGLELIDTIDSFILDGREDSFKNPQGIFVADSGLIYVADTGNQRVVALKQNKNAEFVIENPKNDILPEDFSFSPVKLAVDKADRLYVIAGNVFEGLMYFDTNHEFMRYFGTIKVKVSASDWFWKQFSTQEQRRKMMLFIPTEFTGLDVDDEGFIYTTNIDNTSNQTIKRLNPSGRDVLINYTEKDIIGDFTWPMAGSYKGPTTFIDIVYRDKGIYSALDSKRGRIFTYDGEGNILYIFGGLGTELGMFQKPVAIDTFGGDIYVLDQYRGELVRFSPTKYGSLINEAIQLRWDGDEKSAAEVWQQVLKIDSGCELAYVGIGKSLLAAGENEKAVTYLKKGMDKRYYSVAYKRYRNDRLRVWLPTASIVILSAMVVLWLWRKIRRAQRNE